MSRSFRILLFLHHNYQVSLMAKRPFWQLPIRLKCSRKDKWSWTKFDPLICFLCVFIHLYSVPLFACRSTKVFYFTISLSKSILFFGCQENLSVCFFYCFFFFFFFFFLFSFSYSLISIIYLHYINASEFKYCNIVSQPSHTGRDIRTWAHVML